MPPEDQVMVSTRLLDQRLRTGNLERGAAYHAAGCELTERGTYREIARSVARRLGFTKPHRCVARR